MSKRLAALTAAGIAGDFGPGTSCCQRAVQAFTTACSHRETDARLFALRTYYALIIKLLALHFVSTADQRAAFSTHSGDELAGALADLQEGGPFTRCGLRRFIEPDDYGWYLNAWNSEIESALAGIVHRIYGAGAMLARESAGDVLKALHHELFPREMRHALGEYYTPDWLAERVIRQTLGDEHVGDPQQRVLDPACGSGTFLFKLIQFVRQRAERDDARDVLALILRNVVGIDLNPLAVLAARANYLFALGDLFDARLGDIEIPVYRADSVLEPERAGAPFDCAVGNPPWVNWEHLPESYRRITRPLWEHYGLLPKFGRRMRTILGGAKYDLSALMTYVVLDRCLAPHARLGFVLSQSLFKTGAGQGFRRFTLPDGTPFAPVRVEDMVAANPFDGAATRPVVGVFEKGRAVRYPVSYHVWKEERLLAQPVSAEDPTSPWISASAPVLDILSSMAGRSAYTGRKGVTASAQGVFWLKVHEERCSPETVCVTNVTETGKIAIAPTQAVIEDALLYPLLRGRDVSRWHAAPVLSILLTHEPGQKLRAIPESDMAARFPNAWSYLSRYRAVLEHTGIFKRFFKPTDPFYSMFNIGDYTFAAHKVVIREIAGSLTAAVIGNHAGRAVIPDHKLLLVDTGTSAEAHYLCAVLNSIPARRFVAAYSISTQFSAHLFENLRMSRFDANNVLHSQLAAHSSAAHAAAVFGDTAALAHSEGEINRLATLYWALSPTSTMHLQPAGLQR